jgi:hypothetical protein
LHGNRLDSRDLTEGGREKAQKSQEMLLLWSAPSQENSFASFVPSCGYSSDLRNLDVMVDETQLGQAG